MKNQDIDNAIVNSAVYADDEAYHGVFRRLRKEDPVHWTEPNGYRPFWTITKHADVMEVTRQQQIFENGPRFLAMPQKQEEEIMAFTGGRQTVQRGLLAMNGDEHTAYRAITREWFLPKNVAKLQADVSVIADRFIDKLQQAGNECDFASTVGVWYPLRVIMMIFGLPPEVEPIFQKLSKEFNGSEDPDFRRNNRSQSEHMIEVVQQFFDLFKPIIADRRANPRDDLASIIANARIDGELIPDHLLHSYYLTISIAGHDSTSAGLNGGILAFLRNPDQLALLRERPELMAQATEEILRWTAPAKHFFRNAVADYELRGKKIRAGDGLLLAFPSACRDEDVYEDADRFRIDRRPKPHVAFGYGVHACLGQMLARQEISTFNTQFLRRIPSMGIAAAPTFLHSMTFGGVKSLPVRYTVA